MLPVREFLPPLPAVHRALREGTERLATELDCPTLHAPAWSELEWRLAPAVAAMHGISALLATELRWRGPAHWSAFLARQLDCTRQRYRTAFDSLAAIDELARQDGVAITSLKGAALYSAGVYMPGERPMADLDLLVREPDVAPVHRILTSLGYRELSPSWKHRAYWFGAPDAPIRLGEDPTGGVKIDVHTRVVERLPHRAIDISDLVLPSAGKVGLNGYPSKAALMVHLLFHTAGSMVQHELRLIQLVDLIRVSRRMTQRDWEQILEFDGPQHRLWWAWAPLAMAKRSFPHWTPPPEMSELSHGCPRRLRRAVRRGTVTEISYSRLIHDRFPGIAWTHSYREALGYVLARAVHAQSQLVHARLLTETEAWKHANSGASRSQLPRLLRGIVRRPLRTAPTRTVRAALEELQEPVS